MLPRPPSPTKYYQAGRTHLRVSITMSPEAKEGLDTIRERTGIITLSAAIAWAVDIAKNHLSENPGKNS